MAKTNKENDGSVKFGFEVDDKGLVEFKSYLQRTMNMTKAAFKMVTNTFNQLDTVFPSKTDTPLTDTKLSDIRAQETQVTQASEETTEKLKKNNEEIEQSNERLARSYTLVDYAAVGMFKRILRWSTRVYRSLASAGSNMVETNTRFNRLLGDLADQAEHYAELISNAYAITKTAAKTSITQIYELGKASGMSGKNALELARQITILGAELSSVWDTSTEQAVNALISALQGLPKASKGYSLYLNTAQIKETLKEAGYAVEGELTQQQKIIGTWLKALKDAGYAINDFASTQTSVANQMRLLTSAITTIKENLGAALNEVLSPVLQVINGALKILVSITNQIDKLPKPLKLMLGLVTTFVIAAPALFALIILVSRGVQVLKNQLLRLAESLQYANPKLQIFASILTKQVLPALGRIAAVAGSVILFIMSINALFANTAEEVKKVTDGIDGEKKAIESAGKALGKYDDVATMTFNNNSSFLDPENIQAITDFYDKQINGNKSLNEQLGITEKTLKGIYITIASISALVAAYNLGKLVISLKPLLATITTLFNTLYAAFQSGNLLLAIKSFFVTIAPYVAVIGGIVSVIALLYDALTTDWQSPALAVAGAIGIITQALGVLAFAIGAVTSNFALMKKGMMAFAIGGAGYGIIKTYNTGITPSETTATQTSMSITGSDRFNQAVAPLQQSPEISTMKNDITSSVLSGLAKSGGSTGNINITVNVDEDYIYKAYNRQSALRGGSV